MRVSPWLVVALPVVGCYASYAESAAGDGGASDDGRLPVDYAWDIAEVGTDTVRDDAAADVPTDGPGDHVWTLRQVPATVEAWGCTASPGQMGFAELSVDLRRSCWHVGPAEAEIVDTPTGLPAVEVRAYVWEEHGVPCVDVGAEAPYVYEVALPDLGVGNWQVTEPLSGSTFLRAVSAPPTPTDCTGPGAPAGGECVLDCDCEGSTICAAARGDAWCGSTCQQPCNADVDCPSRSRCRSDWTWAGRGCEPVPDGEDLCGGDGDCPAGMRCAITEHGSFCAWGVELNGATRHVCTVDEECDPGLDCVEHADGSRRCELRCTTPGMVCPAMHGCGMRLGDGSRLWICEWWGE